MEREPFDIVLSAIRLSGMDGQALAERIRQQHPATQVILIASRLTVQSAAAAVRVGACDYLVKPLDDPSQIRTSLDLARLRLEDAERNCLARQAIDSDRNHLLMLLDLLPLGVFFVDAEGRVRQNNRLGDRVAGSGALLRVTADGRLQAADPKDQARLMRHIRVAHEADPSTGARVVGALRLAAERSAETLPVLVVALGRPTSCAGREDAAAAVVVPSPHADTAKMSDGLRGLYGLTTAEARVAALTLAGFSIEALARKVGITEGTARVHLRRVFAKTMTGRQAELVGLLLRGPALLCGAPE